MEYMCFNEKEDISTLNGGSLKLADKFNYFESIVWSIENDINTRLVKAWTAIDRLSIIWKWNVSNKIKCNFFQASVMSVLLYGCTTWMLTKCIEKKLNKNCTRMLRAIWNKSWKQHTIKQQLFSHLPPISKTIQIRQRRQPVHCWKSKNEIRSNVFLWTPSHGCASVGWPTRTYLQQLGMDRGHSLEDLLEAMDDRDECQERIWEIWVNSTTW